MELLVEYYNARVGEYSDNNRALNTFYAKHKSAGIAFHAMVTEEIIRALEPNNDEFIEALDAAEGRVTIHVITSKWCRVLGVYAPKLHQIATEHCDKLGDHLISTEFGYLIETSNVLKYLGKKQKEKMASVINKYINKYIKAEIQKVPFTEKKKTKKPAKKTSTKPFEMIEEFKNFEEPDFANVLKKIKPSVTVQKKWLNRYEDLAWIENAVLSCHDYSRAKKLNRSTIAYTNWMRDRAEKYNNPPPGYNPKLKQGFALVKVLKTLSDDWQVDPVKKQICNTKTGECLPTVYDLYGT